MSELISFERTKKLCGLLAINLVFAAVLVNPAQAAEKVTTYKDKNGWKLQVNGEDHYVKGVVWGYTPKNQNYTYNLWGESDDFVRKVLDYDFGLMKAAGVNTIRSFATIPPKWVTYVYREYGIMTVINPLMGRYGYTVGGKWIPRTDYSDELTRATLKKDTLEVFNTYKDVPGVLMFALGNESNYGLEWSSFEIENLPAGEQNTAKARFLYSLFNEVMKAGKQIAPDKLFMIVNGDIQYIDLIRELCPDLDVLGSNVYRGRSFTALWKDVKEKLDLPVVFTEFGSDAYNARESREDQLAQAIFLKEQWQEMYNKAYGNGEEGNSAGGFVFEWRDEWWKSPPFEERLDIHDTNATWSNQAYLFDWAEGLNNMNEEWFGITALGPANRDGVYTARPRMAYDVLSQIWSMDPYSYKKAALNQAIDDMNMDYLEMKGEVRLLKAQSEEKKKTLEFTGGTLRAEYLIKGSENDIDLRGENGVVFSDGEMAFLDFGFQPSEKIDGQFSLNILGNVAAKEPLEIAYGRRGFPITVITEGDPDAEVLDTTTVFKGRERLELYDFSATYKAEKFHLNTFYHVPRYHWGYEGDFYGLMAEATDLAGMDIWNSKAPEGVELDFGKGSKQGLKVVFGPEVYWGANPKVMVKYSSKFGKFDYTLIHSEDLARRDEGTGATTATSRQSRQTAVYFKRPLADKVTLELGGIMAATEKVDDPYDRVVSVYDAMAGRDVYRNVVDQIDFADTLGLKAKLSFPFLGSLAYVSANHAGLVADGGDPLREFGTRLPYTGLGAKNEYDAGMMINVGNLMIFPRILYRTSLVDANPSLNCIPPIVDPLFIDLCPEIVGGVVNPGLTPRNREDDPFAILSNRDTRAAELFLTYDPTGATPFYQWDNDLREDAGFAFNIGLNYTSYPTPTDSEQFFYEFGGFNAAFGVGLPKEDVYEASTRMVFNPSNHARYIANLTAGYQQSTGDPTGGTRRFYTLAGKAVLGRKHIFSGYIKKDAWGPYDFHRQFNVTYPEQYKLDYSMLLDSQLTEGKSTRIGVKSLYRSLDENSPDGESENGTNRYLFQTVFYFEYNFGGTPPPEPRD